MASMDSLSAGTGAANGTTTRPGVLARLLRNPSALIGGGLVLLFVLIGGVFAGTEMAIVNLRESQIDQLEESGPRGAKTATMVRDPNQFLSAVQIGVTVAGFASAAYGATSIAPSTTSRAQRSLRPSSASAAATEPVT